MSLSTRVAVLATVSALTLVSAAPAWSQTDTASGDDDIIVTAQRSNRTEVIRGGSLGVLGEKDALDVPFSIKSYGETLILNQQPNTLGQLLENDPSVRTTYGFGNASEQFVIRGFTLYGDDVGLNGLYAITPRQLVAPELYSQVQVLNGAVRSGDVAIDDENRRAYVIGASLDYRGERARLFLDLAYQRYEVHGQRPTVSLGAGVTDIPRVPGASHNYGQQFTYSKLRDVFGTLRAEYDLSDKAMLYASFGARDGSEEGVYSGLTVTDAVTGAADGSASYIPYTSNNEAATGGLRVKLDAAGVTRFRGQSLTGDSDLDSRLAFGGGLGRTDRRYGRRVGSDRGAAAA